MKNQDALFRKGYAELHGKEMTEADLAAFKGMRSTLECDSSADSYGSARAELLHALHELGKELETSLPDEP